MMSAAIQNLWWIPLLLAQACSNPRPSELTRLYRQQDASTLEHLWDYSHEIRRAIRHRETSPEETHTALLPEFKRRARIAEKRHPATRRTIVLLTARVCFAARDWQCAADAYKVASLDPGVVYDLGEWPRVGVALSQAGRHDELLGLCQQMRDQHQEQRAIYFLSKMCLPYHPFWLWGRLGDQELIAAETKERARRQESRAEQEEEELQEWNCRSDCLDEVGSLTSARWNSIPRSLCDAHCQN